MDERERLVNNYLDDALTIEDRRRVEVLLQHDEDFMTLFRRQQALVASAAALPRTIKAPVDAWESIVAKIEEHKVVTPDFGSNRQARWRPLMLAAAAVLLMATSSAVTVMVLQRSSREAGPLSPEAIIVRAAADVHAAYTVTIDQLRTVVDQRRDVLTPETVGAIEESLAAIDQAIRQASEALASDPANDLVLRQLETAYRNKVDVLTRAARLVSEM